MNHSEHSKTMKAEPAKELVPWKLLQRILYCFNKEERDEKMNVSNTIQMDD